MATEYRRQQQLRGTEAQWASNDVVVLAGEIALQTGPGTGQARAKIGDGASAFSALPWVFETDALARQSIADVTAVTVTLDSRVTALENTLSAGGTVDQLTAQVTANTAAIATKQDLLANGTLGDLLWWDTDLLSWTPLPIGSPGHVLTVVNDEPTWRVLPVSGGAVPEAPQDNIYYVRRNAIWEPDPFVDVTGDTMTGALTLSGPPVDPLHAATKAYVDLAGGLTQEAADLRYVNVTGDTMTGSLTVEATAPEIVLNRTGTVQSVMRFQNAALNRWSWTMSGAESTGNAGSNLVLTGHDDAGVSLGTLFQLTRSRQVSINGAPINANSTFTVRAPDTLVVGVDVLDLLNANTAADSFVGINLRTASGAIRAGLRGERPGTSNTGDLGIWTARTPGSLTKAATFRANGNLEIDGAVSATNIKSSDDVLVFDFGSGAPTAGQSLSVVMVHDVSIPNNFAGSRGSVLANPASNLVVPVLVGGVQRGTATVSAAGAVTFAFGAPGSALAVTAGTRVTMTMPGTIPSGVTGFAASLLSNRTT